MSLPRPQRPPPLIAPKDAIRLLAAMSMMVFLIWAMTRVQNPRTWSWVENMNSQPTPDATAAPATETTDLPADLNPRFTQAYLSQIVGLLSLTPNPNVPPGRAGLTLSTVYGFEHIPWPERPAAVVKTPAGAPRALVPSQEILRGAIDRKGFLTDDPDEADFNNARRKGDADARYHLLDLATTVSPQDIAKNARTDVRYSALLQKPPDYRGQVIRIQGQLRWLKTFELSRDTIPGVKFVYEGLITVGSDAYWVMFPELPPGLPPSSEWNNLYVHDVTFNGYFLKVLLAENAKGKFPFPVLIGRTLELAPALAGTSFESGFWTLVIVAGTAALLLGIVFWLHGLGERRYAARLAAVRARTKLESGGAASADPANPPLPFEGIEENAEAPGRGNGWPQPSDN